MQLWSKRYGLFKVPLVFREIANAAIGFKQINFMFKVGVFGSGNDTLETIMVGLFVCARSRPSHRKMGTILRPCSSAALYLSRAQLLCSNCVYLRIPLVAAFSPVHSELDWRHWIMCTRMGFLKNANLKKAFERFHI